jgi:hypothetical protein
MKQGNIKNLKQKMVGNENTDKELRIYGSRTPTF